MKLATVYNYNTTHQHKSHFNGSNKSNSSKNHAYCTSSLGCLSVELILFSILMLLSEAAAASKLCWLNLSYLLPDIKVAQFYFEEDFPKKCHFEINSDVLWWTKIFHPFLDYAYQECMIFARIGDGPCYYHWKEICAGVTSQRATGESEFINHGRSLYICRALGHFI